VSDDQPAARTDAEPAWRGRRLHFVGIGGAGMSGLALIAGALGAEVTGSDRSQSAYLAELRRVGIEPRIGEHDAANVPEGAEIVVSSAIAVDNPERLPGAPELHRADLLGELTRMRRCIAVTGTHGKTTTSAMIVHVLRELGNDPSFVIGGELSGTGTNAGWGGGPWIVVEADESDRSLLKLRPEIAVLTNAELDHHTTYRSRLDLEETLRAFMSRARIDVVWDRPALRALCSARELVAYDADPALSPEGSRFVWEGHPVRLTVPGAHYALNAAGALSACAAAGVDPAAAARAIASYRGARRRLEPLGATAQGARVFDSYAHHPTEISGDLAALRTLEPRRLVAVFQPHLFSRTQALAREFGAALALADLIVVLEVYPARERAEDFPGVGGHLVAVAAADASGGRPVAWLPSFDQAEPFLRSALREGDICVVMGAGNVDRLGRSLLRGE
jgi:UDP-N-acetylmuramate--alanine ligase